MRTLDARSLCHLSITLCLAALAAAGCARTERVTRSAPVMVAGEAPDLVARGRYLAYGPAHCVACHTPEGPMTAFGGRDLPPLVGGYAFRFPGGVAYASNLTPDPETGIGRISDAELVRMLRHGIRADGKKAVPVMAYQNLSDEDVHALVSFLRSQPPVRHVVPARSLNLAGRIGMALFVRPLRSGRVMAVSPPAEPTLERGAYLVEVAQCANCHTKRAATGSLKGPRLAGGWAMPVEGDPEHVFVTPNLTPDPETGILATWTEEQFVARFRAGKTFAASHMPWTAYGQMDEDDLRAIYRYLQSLPPVRNATGPTFRAR